MNNRKKKKVISKQRHLGKDACISVLKSAKQLEICHKEDDYSYLDVPYFRMHIQYLTTLWMDEKFSIPKLTDFLQYMNKNIWDIDDTKRKQINERLRSKYEGKKYNVIQFANQMTKVKANGRYVNLVLDAEKENTQICVDYSLIACDYLMNHGYGPKRLSRVTGSVYCLDHLNLYQVIDMRNDMYKRIGMWVPLHNEELPPDADDVNIQTIEA